jgi:hypothetical protein
MNKEKHKPETPETELKRLRYYHDTTVGLWCIDQNPNDVSLEWIRENAFQLTESKPGEIVPDEISGKYL